MQNHEEKKTSLFILWFEIREEKLKFPWMNESHEDLEWISVFL